MLKSFPSPSSVCLPQAAVSTTGERLESRWTTPMESPGMLDLMRDSSTKVEIAGVMTLGKSDAGTLGATNVAWSLNASRAVTVEVNTPAVK